MPDGKSAAFPIQLGANETTELELVEIHGLAGWLSVVAADGSELVEADFEQRISTARNLLIPPGAVTIRIEPVQHGSAERTFELHIGAAHVITPLDRTRLEAEKLLGEGEHLSREQKRGNVDPAILAFQKSAMLWKQLSDKTREATAVLDLGSIRIAKADYKTALEDSQHALDLWTAIQDRNGMASALNEIAVLYVFREQQKKADEAVSQAIELARSSRDDRNLARGLMIRADIRSRRGENDQARADYLEALQLTRSEGDRLAEADALSYLATLEHDLGRFDESVQHGTLALAIDREEDDKAGTGSCLVRLSTIYASRGEFTQAIAYGEEALPLLKDFSSVSRYGNALYNVASYYLHVDNFSRALDDYAEALAIFRKAGTVLGQAYVLSGLAHAHLLLGDTDKSDGLYRESAAEFHKASNKQGEVTALLALGGIARRRHQFSKALELEQQALTTARDAGLRRSEESALANTAETQFQARDFAASAKAAAEKLDLIQKAGSTEQEERANALYQQGRALQSLREYDRAKESLEQALAQYERLGTIRPAADVLYELALLDTKTGHLQEAHSRIAQALDRLESVGAGAGTAETRMLFAASHRRCYDLAIDVAMQLHDSAGAFELSERGRARGLIDLIRGRRLDIRAGVDSALLEQERRIEEKLDSNQDRLTRLSAGAHDPAAEQQIRRQIETLAEEYRGVEARIRASSPRYTSLVQPRNLSTTEVQSRLLDRNTALVEFWLADERSYAWLVTKSGCRGFELPSREKVEALARRAYDALNARNASAQESFEQKQQRISAADQEFAKVSEQLSSMLLGRLTGLETVTRLWIVSDGALEYLPFAAFPMPGTGRPLVATHEIVRLPSALALSEIRQEIAGRPRPEELAAVFADPVFQTDDERVARPRTAQVTDAADVTRAAADVDLAHLPRLYFSRQEADAIRSLAGGRGVREDLDFDASRAEAEKPALSKFQVIHFASHALLDSKHPELSGIVLSMVNREGEHVDGFLRLHDIYNLHLNADLVTLSACQTALGQEVRSEGMVGLTRGLMYAGAPQVLASLWSVRDQATSELMRRFYEGLFELHLTPEAALRRAQLGMMQDRRWPQPYYWAAFTVEGSR
ncbi:MAG TPA: CHAT domain-containing protein [Bryobacteraceae bacterium]|nr:CHAT domain-containing protein [Bryobacteraceae bacterium]